MRHATFVFVSTILFAGCATPLTLSQFVRRHVQQNDGLLALVQAADGGAGAFKPVPDSKIRDIQKKANKRDFLKRLVDAAQDHYRHAMSYHNRIERQWSAKEEGIRLTDAEEPGRYTVPLTASGLEVSLVCQVAEDGLVSISRIDSARGATVLRLDDGQDGLVSIRVTPEFRNYITGDAAGVFGNVNEQIDRSDGRPDD